MIVAHLMGNAHERREVWCLASVDRVTFRKAKHIFISLQSKLTSSDENFGPVGSNYCAAINILFEFDNLRNSVTLFIYNFRKDGL